MARRNEEVRSTVSQDAISRAGDPARLIDPVPGCDEVTRGYRPRP